MKRTMSAVTAAAAAAQRAVKTEPPSSSGGTGGTLVTRRAAAAAAAAMEEDLTAAAEAAASAAAAQHYRSLEAAAAAAMGLQGGYGMAVGDVWGRLDHTEGLSSAGGVPSYGRYTAALMGGAQVHPHSINMNMSSQMLGSSPGGYNMSQLQVLQQQQQQMQGMGSLGVAGMGGTAPPAGMGMSSGMGGGMQRNSMPGGYGGVSSAGAGSGGGAAGALCGSGMLHGRGTASGGSGRLTQQQGDDDAGSSSCCSSRGSPMLSNARRQQRSLLHSAASAPSGSLAHYMTPAGISNASPLASMGSMPPLPPHAGGYTQQQQQQQQLMAANAAAAAGGLPHSLIRTTSASGTYAAARAAAAAAAAARSNPTRSWQPPAQANMMQVGGNSFDSCADIWAAQPGGVDAALAAAGPPAAAGSPAGMYLMHKIGRSRLEQNPGSSARQAAAMADYQALQHQQQQELEQLQIWHRIQTSRQVGSTLGRGPTDLAPILTPADLAAMQGPTLQGLYQPCSGEVNSASINAAMAAAGMHGSSAAAAAAAAGRLMAAPNGTSLPLQGGDFYQGQLPAGVSLQQAVTRDAAAAAAAAELAAVVNPAGLLADGGQGYGLQVQGWGHGRPVEGPAGAQAPVQPPAGSGAAAGAAGAGAAAAQSHGHGFNIHASTMKTVPGAMSHGRTGTTPSGAAAAAAVAAGMGPGVQGLNAGDIADLWDVLEDYEGGDKESCDALFEHLTDLF